MRVAHDISGTAVGGVDSALDALAHRLSEGSARALGELGGPTRARLAGAAGDILFAGAPGAAAVGRTEPVLWTADADSACCPAAAVRWPARPAGAHDPRLPCGMAAG